MASSEIHDTDRDGSREVPPAVVEEAKGPEKAAPHESPPLRTGRAVGAAERARMLKEVRNVEFPSGVRGYQRSAVDRYVERVSRLITELEMYSSPESAVRHALDEVSQETRDILQHAHHSAEEITIRSRAKADERLEQADRDAEQALSSAQEDARGTREAAQRDAQQSRDAAQRDTTELRETAEREITELRQTAEREIQQLRATAERESEALVENARRNAEDTIEAAETRAAELSRSAELIWRERRRLIEDVHAVGEQLVTLGDAEAKRFSALPEELSQQPAAAASGAPGSE